jgi:hypothetical protein
VRSEGSFQFNEVYYFVQQNKELKPEIAAPVAAKPEARRSLLEDSDEEDESDEEEVIFSNSI